MTALWAVALVALVAGAIYLYSRVTRAGAAQARLDTAEAAIEAHEKMADAAAQAPQGRDAVVRRLRDKGL